MGWWVCMVVSSHKDRLQKRGRDKSPSSWFAELKGIFLEKIKPCPCLKTLPTSHNSHKILVLSDIHFSLRKWLPYLTLLFIISMALPS